MQTTTFCYYYFGFQKIKKVAEVFVSLLRCHSLAGIDRIVIGNFKNSTYFFLHYLRNRQKNEDAATPTANRTESLALPGRSA
jgi:hypothetical protein